YKRTATGYYLYILFQTGLRPSELLGLRWIDVDFENREIFVNERVSTITLERVPAKNSASIRTIPVNADTVRVLKELKEKQEDMLNKRKLENPEDLIFFHYIYKRKYLPTNSALTGYLKELLKELKITPVL